MLSFSSKKKERWRPRFQPDASQRGAICWQVVLEEGNGVIGGQCLLAISSDSMVLAEENNHDILLVIPCKSILGWTTQTNRFVCILWNIILFYEIYLFYFCLNAIYVFIVYEYITMRANVLRYTCMKVVVMVIEMN